MAENDPETAWFGGRARRIALPERVDPRGALLPLDFDRLPFEPRRIFVVHDVPAGTTRGGHAHRSSRMLLVRLAGRIDVELRAGGDRAMVVLDRSDTALLLEPGVWAAHTYVTADATILVLADEPFDPAGYSTEPEA
jgi:dTDP-4-dehydrorhamnose 3,5-epimerase-like enzyme